MSWQQIADLGNGAKGSDANGYRAEFVQLVKLAAVLNPDNATGSGAAEIRRRAWNRPSRNELMGSGPSLPLPQRRGPSPPATTEDPAPAGFFVIGRWRDHKIGRDVFSYSDGARRTYSERTMQLTLQRKLAMLADAAKYDASCASSGTEKRNSQEQGGIGSTEGSGICHSYAPDGRCISLLKLLLTNFCVYDCAYCVNRSSSNVERARFSVDEVVALTLDFYRRNYIEGLFLSSGIIRSPDYTMEEMVRVARTLRVTHGFRGYIHLKIIPNAAPELLAEAAVHADRLSTNIELPTDLSLKTLAPEKMPSAIRTAMAQDRTCARGVAARRQAGERQEEADQAGAGGAIDADDRWGGRDRRCRHPAAQRLALCRVRAEARLLLGVFADPRCQQESAAAGAAADARAPAVPGRLADAVLRLRMPRRSRAAARAAFSTSRSIRNWPGR